MVSPHAISLALIKEEGKAQKPIYYTSKALRGSEGRYPPIEKLAFSLVTVQRKLRPYFQAHIINVFTNHPLKKAMNSLKVAGWLIQWAMEFSEFDVRYWPREVTKAQALAKLITKFTPTYDQQNGGEGAKQWIVHVDGSSTQYVGGVGVILQSPKGDRLEYAIRLQFQTTNN